MAASVPNAVPWLASQRLIIAGSFFVAAASAVAYADAGYTIVSPIFAIVVALSFLVPFLFALPFARWWITGPIVLALGAALFVEVTFLDPSTASTIATALLMLGIVVAVLRGFEDATFRLSLTAIGLTTLSILLPQIFAPAQLTPEAFAFAEQGKGGRPYLHIILDEMGPLFMMPDTPEFAALQQRMRTDYAKRGFDVFDDTEVVAGATHISLADVFAKGRTRPAVPDGEVNFVYRLRENRLLDDLRTAGYRVNVLQNSFLRLCASADEACRSYARSGDGAAIEASAGSFGDKLRYVLLDLHLMLMNTEYTRASSYYRGFALVGETMFGLNVPRARHFVSRPPQVVKLMRETAANLSALGRGEAFVGHFLLPHFPYVLGADCALKGSDRRAAPRWTRQAGEAPFVLEETEAAYWEQAACTHDTLMAMIDAVSGTEAGKDAVVVVHGDHGSRILEKIADPHGEDAGADPEERRHALFTHFAVRGLADRQVDDLAARPTLRARIGIVLDALLQVSDPDPAATASTGR